MAFLVVRHSRVPSHVSTTSGSTAEDSMFDFGCRSPMIPEDPYTHQQWCEEESEFWYTNYAQDHNVWHMRLLADSANSESIRYVAMPQKDQSKDPKFSGTAVAPTYGFRLFIGQIKREMTAFQLRYLLRAACGVTPRMVKAKEGSSCWLVVVDTEEDFVALRNKNGRILCDMDGAFVDDSVEGDMMRKYCTDLKSQAHSYGHSYVLPRNAIVIEREDARHHHHPKSPGAKTTYRH